MSTPLSVTDIYYVPKPVIEMMISIAPLRPPPIRATNRGHGLQTNADDGHCQSVSRLPAARFTWRTWSNMLQHTKCWQDGTGFAGNPRTTVLTCMFYTIGYCSNTSPTDSKNTYIFLLCSRLWLIEFWWNDSRSNILMLSHFVLLYCQVELCEFIMVVPRIRCGVAM